MREGDVVLVSPWEFQSDSKGDSKWRYTHNQAEWLGKNRYLRV